MSKKLVDGVWVIVCDWKDPKTGKPCDLGLDGEPAMFHDPDGGRNPNNHFQCGAHHGVVKQKDKPEFQVPKGYSLVPKMEYLDEDGGYIAKSDDDRDPR